MSFTFHSCTHGSGIKLLVIVMGISLIGVFATSALLSSLQHHLTEEYWRIGLVLLLALGLLVGLVFVALKDNTRLLAEMQRQEQETITLYRLMLRIASSLEFDHVVNAIAEGARQILGAGIGVVGLVDAKRTGLRVVACTGSRTEIWKDLYIPLQGLGWPDPPGAVQPIVVEELTTDLTVPHIAELLDQEGIVSVLAVPMWRQGHLYGFVAILTRLRRHFDEHDIQLFTRFVLQVVVAIENADLYKQVRYVATLEERDRLARELHDNLAQTLGYLNTQASIAKHRLANQEVEGAFATVLELERVTDQVYADVREAIFSLRTIEPSGWEFIPTLREYLADYEKHYGITTRLVLADESYGGLDPEVQVQANRIIQEALTNVRKHSGARRAWVKFEREDHTVRISVEDDGGGFNPAVLAGEGSQHFGLQIMRERAISVGATLDIDSAARAGTRVVLSVPFLSCKEESA